MNSCDKRADRTTAHSYVRPPVHGCVEGGMRHLGTALGREKWMKEKASWGGWCYSEKRSG